MHDKLIILSQLESELFELALQLWNLDIWEAHSDQRIYAMLSQWQPEASV